MNTVQLEVQLRNGDRQEIDWLPAEEVASLIAHPGGVTPSNNPRIGGIPLPVPTRKRRSIRRFCGR